MLFELRVAAHMYGLKLQDVKAKIWELYATVIIE